MKNVALLMVLILALSSCSLLNNDKKEVSETPIIEKEVSTEVSELITEEGQADEDDMNDSIEDGNIIPQDIITEELIDNDEKESMSIETEVSVELDNDVESEEALNEVFNEIEELFELAEQNGGQ
jgi:hypothetical protein